MAYIHPDNQTLLWNTIQKAPNFEKLGDKKTQWFKSVIRDFYEQEGKSIKTQSDLQNVNKSTITYMVHLLKQITPNPIHKTQYPSMTSLPSTTGSVERINQYTEQFNHRQKEYEMMNAKPLPPPIDAVNEKISDEAITNMDELIRQQLAQREQELKMFGQSPQQNLPLGKLKINEEVSIETIAIEPKKEGKSVSWKENNETDYKKEIEELRNIIYELKETVEYLKSQIQTSESKKEEECSM
jgi:hypothetical protein